MRPGQTDVLVHRSDGLYHYQTMGQYQEMALERSAIRPNSSLKQEICSETPRKKCHKVQLCSARRLCCAVEGGQVGP